MIDIHSHLLYGVDDGAANMEESIRMLSEAQKVGVHCIISTTHYHDDLFSSDKVKEIYSILSVKALDFGIVLKAGYEVFITDSITEKVNKHSEFTMNNSNFFLVEFPYSEFPAYSYEVLYKLHLKGIKPIIAHPERCRCFIENPDILMSFIEGGCYIEVDAASIIGVYGRHAKRMAKRLLQDRKVNFVASNAHFADDYTDWFKKAYTRVKSWVGDGYTQDLFTNNAKIIINNSDTELPLYSNA